MSGGNRKTNNSQKSKNNMSMEIKEAGAAKSPTLNQAFVEDTQKEMAGMSEIIRGNFINEAFENISTDEKLSVILTELYKLKEGLTTLQRSSATLEQQVDTHEQELQIQNQDRSQDEGDDFDENDKRTLERHTNDIIGLHNEDHDLGNRISTVERTVSEQARSINLLKGTVHRQHKQISTNQHKIVDLTARSMDHNLTISGLIEGRNENCKLVVIDFLQSRLNLTFNQNDILVAHRTGMRNPRANRARLMVVRVTSHLKELILSNTYKLKGKLNDNSNPFFVNVQVPEAVAAERKAIQHEVRQIKKFNEDLPAGFKKKQFNIQNKKLYVDDKLHEQYVFPPKPLDIFVGPKEQEQINEIELTTSRPKTHENSHFVGLAAKVHSLQQATLAYKKVRQLYPSYDHVMMAYRIDEFTGYQDDGEHSAGIKIHTKNSGKEMPQHCSVCGERLRRCPYRASTV